MAQFGALDYGMRVWLDPNRPGGAQAHRHRRGRRHPGAERAGHGRGARCPRPSSTCRHPATALDPVRTRHPAAARRPTARRSSSTRSGPGGGWRAWRSSGTSSCGPTRTAPSLRLRDVARVELGSQVYNAVSKLNNRPAAMVAVLPVARRQRAHGGRRGPCEARDPLPTLPAGRGVQGPLRHHRRGARLRAGGHPDPVHHLRPGGRGHLPLPSPTGARPSSRRLRSRCR